jgi:hypothetical protein
MTSLSESILQSRVQSVNDLWLLHHLFLLTSQQHFRTVFRNIMSHTIPKTKIMASVQPSFFAHHQFISFNILVRYISTTSHPCAPFSRPLDHLHFTCYLVTIHKYDVMVRHSCASSIFFTCYLVTMHKYDIMVRHSCASSIHFTCYLVTIHKYDIMVRRSRASSIHFTCYLVTMHNTISWCAILALHQFISLVILLRCINTTSHPGAPFSRPLDYPHSLYLPVMIHKYEVISCLSVPCIRLIETITFLVHVSSCFLGETQK